MPTQLIASWPLSCTMFDGDVLAGPVPTLFAESTEEALEAITADPGKAHYDVMKIHRMFFMPEHVDLEAAVAAAKKPRYVNNTLRWEEKFPHPPPPTCKSGFPFHSVMFNEWESGLLVTADFIPAWDFLIPKQRNSHFHTVQRRSGGLQL